MKTNQMTDAKNKTELAAKKKFELVKYYNTII